ncbi:MAG: hypothetical protein WCW77_00345 [Patescibacteria group bacterium]|jgi:hypothetical protein
MSIAGYRVIKEGQPKGEVDNTPKEGTSLEDVDAKEPSDDDNNEDWS